MIILLALIMLLMPAQAPVIQDVQPIVREITPAVIEQAEEDDWQSIFWSCKLGRPFTAIQVALPEGETIKISFWTGEWYEGSELIVYKGKSGVVDISCAEGLICDRIAIYSTGLVEDLKVLICYVDMRQI